MNSLSCLSVCLTFDIQYEGERRPLAQELIAFDKWYAEGFSAKARAKLLETNTDIELPDGPFEYAPSLCAYASVLTGKPQRNSQVRRVRHGDWYSVWAVHYHQTGGHPGK